ncbi:MAG: cytidine deaminase [Bacteroidota bacterium]
MQTRPTLELLSQLNARAYVPYSGKAQAAILVLSDGAWVPGVRVENASFSLSITAVENAVTTAVTLGRTDITGVVSSAPMRSREVEFLQTIAGRPLSLQSDTRRGHIPQTLPATPLPLPYTDAPPDAVAAVRVLAHRARVPASSFPVGCLAHTPQGATIPGVNVETDDWGQILCAERNALSTALSYGYTSFTALTLTCPRDPSGTPCGSCRQVIVELATDADIRCDRHDGGVETYRPDELLPAFFVGGVLRTS